VPRRAVVHTVEVPVRVLLCDDHALLTDGLAAVLTANGIEVVGVVHRAVDLLPAVIEAKPDVLLLDFQLPDGDGVTLTREVLAAQPNVRIVMLTSADDGEVARAAMEAGAQGFVTKQNPSDEVVYAVVAAAQGQVVVSSDMLRQLMPRPASTSPAKPATELTPRELEVLTLMAEGSSNDQIARELFISRNTVRSHVQSLLSKLDAHSRLEAVVQATRAGVIKPR
jgi:DNA-binding NarL/FixJ family response regulator